VAIFCVTDSERKAGYFSISFMFTAIYVHGSTSPETAFENFVFQSSGFLVASGLILGIPDATKNAKFFSY
jgi:PPE-repeat protein